MSEEDTPFSMEIDEETRRKQRKKIEGRSVDALAKKYAQENRAAIEEAEAHMAPPVITVPQCHVCTSERRLWIERQLMKGRSYSAIAKSLPPEKIGGEERKIDRRSIGHHAKEHMPLDQAVVRAMLEEEADLVGQNWEEGVRGAITARGMFAVMMQKGFEDAMSGTTTIEPRDFVQMAKVYRELTENESVAATEEAKTAVRIFMEAIQNVVIDMFDRDQAEELKGAIVDEVRRLRSRDEIDVEVERHLHALPPAV